MKQMNVKVTWCRDHVGASSFLLNILCVSIQHLTAKTLEKHENNLEFFHKYFLTKKEILRIVYPRNSYIEIVSLYVKKLNQKIENERLALLDFHLLKTGERCAGILKKSKKKDQAQAWSSYILFI